MHGSVNSEKEIKSGSSSAIYSTHAGLLCESIIDHIHDLIVHVCGQVLECMIKYGVVYNEKTIKVAVVHSLQ